MCSLTVKVISVIDKLWSHVILHQTVDAKFCRVHCVKLKVHYENSQTFKTLIVSSSLSLMRQALKVSLSTLDVVAKGLVAKIAIVSFPHSKNAKLPEDIMVLLCQQWVNQ